MGEFHYVSCIMHVFYQMRFQQIPPEIIYCLMVMYVQPRSSQMVAESWQGKMICCDANCPSTFFPPPPGLGEVR